MNGMNPVNTYIPLFEDDPDITQYPEQLKVDPKLRDKYRLARSILTDLVQDVAHDIFMAMPWEKNEFREKQRMARLDLERYNNALQAIGRMNTKKSTRGELV